MTVKEMKASVGLQVSLSLLSAMPTPGAGAEFQLMQRQQLAGLQGEIESLRREVERTRTQRQAPPPPPPPPPLFPGGARAQLQASTSLVRDYS